MRWMWIVAGAAAACAALVLFAIWTRRAGRSGRGEVSVMATVRRVNLAGPQGPVVSFALPRDRELRFRMPGSLARELAPGQSGVLTYRGQEFVYFVRREDPGETTARAV